MTDALGRGYGKLYLSGRDDRVPQLAYISLADGKNNSSVGLQAGARSSRAGGNCTFFGAYAGHTALADASTFVGSSAGRAAQRIGDSVFLGYKSGEFAQRIESSTLIGALTGRKMQRANDNTVIGYASGAELVSGSRNCLIGSYSGYHQYSAHDNVAIGHRAGHSNRIGSNNVFIGSNCAYSAYATYENVVIGHQAGQDLSTGSKNVVCGYHAGKSMAGASNCIAIGTHAMEFFNNGDTNTCLGTDTARTFTGTNNTILGGYSASNAIGMFTTVVGAHSMNRRNGGRVDLSNCVIVGENIRFDVPLRTVKAIVDELIVTPAAQTDSDTDLIITDAAATVDFQDRAVLRIDSAPVGNPLPIDQRLFRLGTDAIPVMLDITTPGSYVLDYGGAIVDTDAPMLSPIPLRVTVDIGDDLTITLLVYDTVVRTWSKSYAASFLDLVIVQSVTETMPSVVIKFRPTGQSAWDVDEDVSEHSATFLPLERDATVSAAGEVTVYVRTDLSTDVVPGMELCISNATVSAIDGQWRIISIGEPENDVTPLTIGPASIGQGTIDLGSSVTAYASKKLSVTNVTATVVQATSNSLLFARAQVPSLASALESVTPLYAWFDSGIIVGRRALTVIDDALGLVEVELFENEEFSVGESISLGTMTIGTIEPTHTAVIVTATGASKRIRNFYVYYNQRSDSDIIVKEFFGPARRDGHTHRGNGTQAEMDATIGQKILTFPSSGYAAADYVLGSYNVTFSTSVSFQLPNALDSPLSFGIEWLSSYVLECTAEDTASFGYSLRYVANAADVLVAQVGPDTVFAPQGNLRIEAYEEVLANAHQTRHDTTLPLDVQWVRDVSLDATCWVDLYVSYNVSSPAFLRVGISGMSDTHMRRINSYVRLANPPPYLSTGSTLSYFATGATQAYGITIMNTRYRETPEFRDCIFLGSNYVIENETERSNVFIAALGTSRLFRGKPETFEFFSNTVSMPSLTIDGRTYGPEDDPSVPSLTIGGSKPVGDAGAGNALVVHGDAMFEGNVAFPDGTIPISAIDGLLARLEALEAIVL